MRAIWSPLSIESHKIIQWAVAIIAGVSMFIAGIGTSWALAALPQIRKGEAGFNMTTEEESWAASITYLGTAVASLPAGAMMDLIGRKWALILFNCFSASGWALMLTAWSPWILYCGRVLMGAWASAAFTIVPVYLGESIDARIRGAAVSLSAVALYAGNLYQGALGPSLNYTTLNALNTGLALLYFIPLLWIPESPYFLLMKGKNEAAEVSIARLKGPKGGEELARIKTAVAEQMENPSRYGDIFRSPALRHAFLLALVLRLIQRGSGQVILSAYVSVTLPDSFLSAERSATLLGVVWLLASIGGVSSVDRLGRKPIILLSCAGIFLTMIPVSVWFFLKEKTSVNLSSWTWFPLAALLFHGVAYAIGMVSIPTVVSGEIFPVNVKSKASSLCTISTASTSALFVKLYLPVSESFGTYVNFLVCALSGLLGGIFIKRFMFETKGKTLEEIQCILIAKTSKVRVIDGNTKVKT